MKKPKVTKVPVAAADPAVELLDAAAFEAEVEANAIERKQHKTDRRNLLTIFAREAVDQKPVAVYLARFASKDGRRVQFGALKTIARVFSEGKIEDPDQLPWGELKYQHVVALRSKLQETCAPATTNRYMSALKGVAEEAMRLNILNPDEFARIHAIKGVKGKRLPAGRHLDENVDLVPIFDGVDSQDNRTCAVRDRAIIGLIRVTGIRRHELTELLYENVNWTTLRATLIGKGNKERAIFMRSIEAELKAWLRLRGTDPGPLFYAVHKSGAVIQRKMVPSSVAFIVNRAAENGGLDAHVSPHDFRHTYAGDMLDAGKDISVVSGLLGHANIETTKQYDRRPERVAADAAEAVKMPARSTDGGAARRVRVNKRLKDLASKPATKKGGHKA